MIRRKNSDRLIPVSKLSPRTSLVHPFDIHFRNLCKCSSDLNGKLAALKSLKLELQIISEIPYHYLDETLLKSFSKNVPNIIKVLLKLITHSEFQLLIVEILRNIFAIEIHILESSDSEGSVCVKEFFEIFISQGLCSDETQIVHAICDHILEIVPQQVLQIPNHKELYINFLMSLLQALLSLDKEDLYSTFVHHLPVSVLDTFPLNKQENGIKTALSAMECEKGLLWSNFAKNFDCSSFLLSQELFVDINLLASGNLSGKRAQLIANEVSQSIDSCLVDSILVVKTSKEEKLLVKTLKISVICAIAELFIMDSNFTLVLQGMQFFSKIISAISEAEPKDISKRDFDTLLVK